MEETSRVTAGYTREVEAHLADCADRIDQFLYDLSSAELISTSLEKTLEHSLALLNHASDITVQRWSTADGLNGAAIFAQGIVNMNLLVTAVLERMPKAHVSDAEDPLSQIAVGVTPLDAQHRVSTLGSLAEHVLDGSAVLLVDGVAAGLAVEISNFQKRSIEQPSSSPVVIGPHDGFIEDASTNLSLVRQRIRSPRLQVQEFRVGRLTRTPVLMLHLFGVVDDQMVTEVRRRLSAIDIDGVLESNYLIELMRDAPRSMFPTIQRSDRPDTVSAALLEGRVVLICGGSPYVLMVPTTFGHFLKSAEDYYQSWQISSIIRLVRLGALAIGIFVPALYLALVTFHQELIPTPLLLTLAASRENVPLPSIAELLLLLLMFEVIREAGARVPQGIGSALTIGGTLVVGEAAVRAGIISSPIIIVTAAVVIAFFAIPDYDMVQTSRFLLYPLVIGTAVLGAYGLLFVSIALLLHLASLRSFGTPYLSPYAPMKQRDWKDSIWRAPWWSMNTRPTSSWPINDVRQERHQRPRPPS